MRKDRLLMAVTALSLVARLALAADSGTALRDTEIKVEPFRDARTVAMLLKGEPADILRREGGWMQVDSGKGKGWVHMLNIRRAGAQKGTGDQSGLLSLASGRTGSSGTILATTGIRGLDSSQTAAGLGSDGTPPAKFNEAELMRDESFGAKGDKVLQFAKQGGLAVRQVDPLPDGK